MAKKKWVDRTDEEDAQDAAQTARDAAAETTKRGAMKGRSTLYDNPRSKKDD